MTLESLRILSKGNIGMSKPRWWDHLGSTAHAGVAANSGDIQIRRRGTALHHDVNHLEHLGKLIEEVLWSRMLNLSRYKYYKDVCW